MLKKIVVLAALITTPASAVACEFYPPNPARILKDNNIVVVAYPVGISNIPRAANNPSYRDTFRQTILWRVVVSWKGKYQPGDQFTTRKKLSRAGMCSPGAGLYTLEPLILAFSGSEPYTEFADYSSALHPEVFQYFQKRLVRKGT